ncbi:YidH family protein [Peribacillus sp. B-H-3]|uniref:YidH family protein n=1 Tax=Peribacillus sp. B-H-3 TaxID=3400420 RepID=UPI003B01E325
MKSDGSLKNNEKETIDSKYIQQHLANERTFLAWVRTSITIIGVGFLITNLHFSTLSKLLMGDVFAAIIGIGSIAAGIAVLILSSISYFRKGKDINQQTFRFSKKLIIFLSLSLLIIFLLFGAYYLVAWRLM